MMLPPALLRLRIRGPHSAWPTLWLPLFLLWPLLLVVFVLLSPFVLGGLLVLCAVAQLSVANALQLFTRTYALVCAMRGTHVDVVSRDARVLLTLY
jgi:hypothetical protein